MRTVVVVLTGELVLLVLLAWLMPALSNKTVPFGVRIPAQHIGDPVIAQQLRSYRRRVLVGGVLSTATSALLALVTGQHLVLAVAIFVLLGIWYFCYYLAHSTIRAAKASEGWYEGLRQGVAADISLRTDPPPFPWLWTVPALLVLAATIVAGVLRYPAVPDPMAMHYAGPVADRWVHKSVGAAFSLVFVQAGMTALLLILARSSSRARPDIDPAGPVSSARRQRGLLARMTKALLVFVALFNVTLFAVSWQIWDSTAVKAPLMALTFVPIAVGVAVLVVVARRAVREQGANDEDTGLTHRDDDRFWRAGLFYVNREDPTLWVPRRFGIGWTVNFGNISGQLMLVGGLVAILLPVILLTR